MAVITISKECGTSSEELAAILAKKLGYEYIGKTLVAKIAKELNISASDVELFRKDSESRLLRFIDRFTCTTVQKVVDREYGCLDDKNYFNTTKKLVEDVYSAGNAIILGWGGQCILRQKPDVLHVRLIKDKEAKIKTIMERLDLGEKAAENHVVRQEKDSQSYVKHYFDEDWNDVRLYDLVLDMGKINIEQGVNTIHENLKHKGS